MKHSQDPLHDDNEIVSEQPDEIEADSRESLIQKLNDAEQKANEYWERILRMQADSDNAKRRYEKEIANAHKYALEKFINELLPIVDSLELSLVNETTAVEGVQLTLNMFYAAMEKFGVQAVNPAAGEAFNPEFQQAISVQESNAHAPGTVLNVLQKGYILHNRLVRPALVVVAK